MESLQEDFAMRWILFLAGAILIYPGLSRAQRAPTACPTNYTCSYQSSSQGPNTEGQPQSQVGFLTFDAAGNWSGVLSGNVNGTVVANRAVSGTCVSGTNTTTGTLNAKAGLGGNPAALGFVTTPNGTHTDLLLAGSMLSSDTRVTLGVCHGN